MWFSAALESAVQFSLWLCLIAIVIYVYFLPMFATTAGITPSSSMAYQG